MNFDPPLYQPVRTRPGRELKYQKIEAAVRKLTETLPLQAKMPTERELAANFGCSVLTVRKGLQVLVDEGIITRRMGSGTFVNRRPPAPAKAQRSLGVLVWQPSDAYAYRVLQSLAQTALAQDIHPRSLWISGFGDDALRQIQELVREGCTAFTMPWFPHDRTEEVRAFIQTAGLRISVPELIPGLEDFCFEAPSAYGRQTTRVIDLLCRFFSASAENEFIAYIGPDETRNAILQQQLVAYTSAMSQLDRTMLLNLVAPTAAAMDELARRWSAHRGKLAIVSYDDEHALRFMTAMHKLGLRAPHDYRIVGYNDTDASHFSDPPLASVTPNFEHISTWLIRSALALADGGRDQAREVPDCAVIVRETCGRVPKSDDKNGSPVPGLRLIIELPR
jgi:DNA-binding transcriptional regulator YhcF (GntR family)